MTGPVMLGRPIAGDTAIKAPQFIGAPSGMVVSGETWPLWPGGAPTGASTGAFAHNNQYNLFPFVVERTFRLTGIWYEITTAQTGPVYLGVYAANANWAPSSNIADLGTGVTDSTGVKTITLGAAVTLPPGRYYLSAYAAGTIATYRVTLVTVPNFPCHMGIGGTNFNIVSLGTAGTNVWSWPGAWPASLTIGAKGGGSSAGFRIPFLMIGDYL